MRCFLDVIEIMAVPTEVLTTLPTSSTDRNSRETGDISMMLPTPLDSENRTQGAENQRLPVPPKPRAEYILDNLTDH